MADYECDKVKIWQKNSRFGTWWLLFGNGHGVCYILGQTNIKYSINFKKYTIMITTRNNQYWLPEVFNDFFNNDFVSKKNATSPAINVVEKENEYDVQYAAPGMTKDDFKVSLDEEQNLVVELEKAEQKEDDNNGVFLRREFSFSNFQQKLILPEDVDHEKISASVANGVLTVVLPKKNAEEQKKEVKMIEIQ